MDEALQIALDFVEGRMTGAEFEQALYSNASLETLLRDDSLAWHNTYIKTDPYSFLIWLKYASPADVLNAQGAVELFLTQRNISFKPTESHAEYYDLLRSAQPGWLDVDDAFLTNSILPHAGDRQGSALRTWLQAKLRELFRFRQQPPDWIQSPAWPITKNGPMYFLGQLSIDNCEHFHDVAAAYIFLDLVSGETKTVIQVY